MATIRRSAPALVTVIAAGFCGLVIGAAALGPYVGFMLGVTVLMLAAMLGVSSERLVWIAVCALVLTITWNGIRIGGGAVGNAFMAIAFASVVAHLILARRSLLLPPWLLVAASGFLLAGLVTLVFPTNLELANRAVVQQETLLGPYPPYLPARSDIGSLFKFELALVIVPLVVVVAASSARKCARLLDLWALGSVINALAGVLDYAGLHVAPYAIEANRSSGLTIHPNYLALSSVLAIPAAMLWFGRSRRWNVAAAAGLCVLLGGVYASGSRDGIVAAAIAIVTTAVAVPRLRRIGLLALPVLGVGLVFVATYTNVGRHVIHQLRLGAGDTSAAGSDYERGADARLALTQIGARPVAGVGFSVITDAHVIYLQVLAAGGVIALISFLTYLGGLGACARRAWRSAPRDLVAAVVVTIAVWLVNGVFDNQVADKYLYVVPGILIALARLQVRWQPAPQPVATSPSRAFAPVPLPAPR